MDWLYVWSPRYRFFHEFLQATLKDISGFHIQPVFAEQKFFTPMKGASSHFLAGIPIKIHVIKNYIEQNIGKTFFFTDVDLIVLPEFHLEDLEPYKLNDITTMTEEHSAVENNIGCMLIHCSPKTHQFFQRVYDRIVHERMLDQDAFCVEKATFDGTIGVFKKEAFLQSNMLSENSAPYKIIQCLTSKTDSTEILIEKVLTIQSAYDITALLHFLPEEVQKELDTEFGVSEP